jgi:hypothetical protein
MQRLLKPNVPNSGTAFYFAEHIFYREAMEVSSSKSPCDRDLHFAPP